MNDIIIFMDQQKIETSSFEEGPLNKKIKIIPTQYEGLDAETLDFIWTIPEYIDPEKTQQEKERKSKAIEYLRKEEVRKNKKEENKLNSEEEAEIIRTKLGVSDMSKPEFLQQDEFTEFRMKNGETDEGFFWNEYRNKKAKEMKNSGEFEWGKERIYFDIKIEDVEKLRDISIEIAGKNQIPIAFKYIDDKKTFPVHKDGKETRFVANFANSDDARRFYKLLSVSPEYRSLIGDRKLDYKGIRIDDIAEYASGFREKRGALERILSAKQNDLGNYEYISDNGRQMSISPEIYKNFIEQYQKMEEGMNREREKWNSNKNNG